eukprot:1814186-Rhodomonas_salina.2
MTHPALSEVLLGCVEPIQYIIQLRIVSLKLQWLLELCPSSTMIPIRQCKGQAESNWDLTAPFRSACCFTLDCLSRAGVRTELSNSNSLRVSSSSLSRSSQGVLAPASASSREPSQLSLGPGRLQSPARAPPAPPPAWGWGPQFATLYPGILGHLYSVLGSPLGSSGPVLTQLAPWLSMSESPTPQPQISQVQLAESVRWRMVSLEIEGYCRVFTAASLTLEDDKTCKTVVSYMEAYQAIDSDIIAQVPAHSSVQALHSALQDGGFRHREEDQGSFLRCTRGQHWQLGGHTPFRLVCDHLGIQGFGHEECEGEVSPYPLPAPACAPPPLSLTLLDVVVHCNPSLC